MKKILTILSLILIISCSKRENKIFVDFQRNLSNVVDTLDRQQCVNNFFKKLSQKDYPIFENDSTVVLLYKGKADKVEMIGDLNYWTNPAPFQQIANTDLYFLRLDISQNSILEYWLIIDDKTQIDSLNRYKIENEFGYASQIVDHTNPFYLDKMRNQDQQLYKTYLVPRENNKYLKIYVYLPPQYNDYENYPLVVFLDGKNYVDFGEAPTIIDNLINDEKIENIVAIFVELGFDIDSDDNIVNFYNETSQILSSDLIDFIENKFSVLNNPEARVIVGKSIAGGVAVLTALENPDKFGNVFCQSGYLSAENNLLSKMLDSPTKHNINFYFQIGIYERNISHMIIPPGETDFYNKNCEFADLLKKQNYSVKIDEYSAGHTWGNWKNHLSEGLLYFFEKNASNPG